MTAADDLAPLAVDVVRDQLAHVDLARARISPETSSGV
jgi:hypothetical protein